MDSEEREEKEMEEIWEIIIPFVLMAVMVIMNYMYQKKIEDMREEMEDMKQENMELRSWGLDILFHMEEGQTFKNQKKYDEETRRIEKWAQELDLM